MDLQPLCDGCGALFTVVHALNCCVGGQRHYEVRDAVGDLASLAWGQVTREPVVCESFNNSSGVTLIADFRYLVFGGLNFPQVDVLFDVCVVDTDAPSYCNRSQQIVLHLAEAEKKQKYVEAFLAHHACFTPLCFSIDGMLGTKADIFIRRLAYKLSTKLKRPYSAMAGWIHSRLYFGILRATMLCMRGTRMCWRSHGILDGTYIE